MAEVVCHGQPCELLSPGLLVAESTYNLSLRARGRGSVIHRDGTLEDPQQSLR